MKHFFFVAFLFFAIAAQSQKYNTLAGIRIGDDFGVSFAQRVANKTTIELNIQPGTFAGRDLVSVLAKQHYPLLSKRFNFFMGAGPYFRKTPSPYIDNPKSETSAGLALSFGGEITIGNLSIAADYLPLVTFNKNDSNQRFYTSSGLSLRYVMFGRESSTKKFFKNLFKKKKK